LLPYIFHRKDAIFFVLCYMSLHVEALAFKARRLITNITKKDNQSIIDVIQAQLDNFDRELPRLKEVTTVLEFALGS